ncbi:MAG: hypothetical protein ABSE84_08500, partial [Isosphaeraceae bacterium]
AGQTHRRTLCFEHDLEMDNASSATVCNLAFRSARSASEKLGKRRSSQPGDRPLGIDLTTG